MFSGSSTFFANCEFRECLCSTEDPEGGCVCLGGGGGLVLWRGRVAAMGGFNSDAAVSMILICPDSDVHAW